MKVRQLTSADAQDFRKVRLDALQLHPDAYGSTYAQWKDLPLDHYEQRIDRAVLIGLFKGADLVGTLAYDREMGGNARHRVGIHAVYIDASVRGQGGIDLLVSAAVDQGMRDGVLQLELSVSETNKRAFAAYVRLRFEQTGVTPRASLIDGRFLDEIQMVRRLDDT